MRHVLLIESAKPADPRWQGRNHWAMSVWDCRVGTPYAIPYDNSEVAEFIERTPEDLRAVRFNWFGDPRISGSLTETHAHDCAAELRGKRLRLTFTDQEHWPRDRAWLTQALAPMSAISDFSCNFNDCSGGKAWWGPYDLKTGTASCAQAYDAATNKGMGRMFETIRTCAPNLVITLPICERRDPVLTAEYGTANIYARTRQLINYAASYAVKTYTLAEYMLPDEYVDRYIRFVSQCLADADRCWPEEAAA